MFQIMRGAKSNKYLSTGVQDGGAPPRDTGRQSKSRAPKAPSTRRDTLLAVVFLFRTKFEMVGDEGPCPLTAPCLSVLWLSVGLRGVVDVPPAAWVAMPDLDRTALPSSVGSERATSKPTELLQANAAAFQRQAQTAETSREVVGRAS